MVREAKSLGVSLENVSESNLWLDHSSESCNALGEISNPGPEMQNLQ